MKYPGVPPAGRDGGTGGWALAATDLPAAEHALRTGSGPLQRLQLAEVLRRRFRIDEALAVLGEARSLAEQLCVGTCHWTVGDPARALSTFRALRARVANGSPDERLAVAIGEARATRVRIQGRRSRRVLDRAVALADGVDDVHLLADLDRERAAWSLLAGIGDAAEAARRAERAAGVHRAAGDEYLHALAMVLLARARNASGDEDTAVDLLREQVAVGRRIGSWDVEQLALVFLGQVLQRGAGPDSARWGEAERILTGLLARDLDPFTEAEVLLPLANLHMNGGALGTAEQELDRYGQLYADLGGNRVSAGNLARARGRLEIVRRGGGSLHDLPRHPAAVAAAAAAVWHFRRAARAYRRAGFEPGGSAVRRDLDMVAAMVGLDAWRPRSGPAEPLSAVLHDLARATVLLRSGDDSGARTGFRAAEAAAVPAGATVLAAVAAAGLAEACHAGGGRDGALAAMRSCVAHIEGVRAAVGVGGARGHVVRVVRDQYERVLRLAAQLGDGPLAADVAERLRTESLAGLLRRDAGALPADVADLLPELDDVNAALAAGLPDLPDRGSTRSARLLARDDAAGLRQRRADLHLRLGERTNRLFADTVGAEPVPSGAPTGTGPEVLWLVPLTGTDEPDVLVGVWRSADGTGAEVTVAPLDAGLRRLRGVLIDADDTDRRRLTCRDLDPVRAALPAALCTPPQGRPRKLVVVPTGWTWTIPIAAVPLDGSGGRLLTDEASIVLSPSERFHRALTRRSVPTAPAAAVSWTDPDAGFRAPEVAALDAHRDGHVVLGDAGEVRAAFVRGGATWRTAVLAAHGNREPGLAHAVVAGGRAVLTAADFLDGDAAPPLFVSLASCHSGYPDSADQHEPLGLALTALAAGATNVLSAHVELGSGPLVRCLAGLYEALAADPTDVASALRNQFQLPRLRSGRDRTPLYRWAALAVVGTHLPPPHRDGSSG
jgi:tetratricopeptide (TPR) repeat protein